METLNNNNRGNGQLIAGIIIIVLGLALALKNFGVFMPFWIFSWHTIMLVVGLLIGYRKDFKVGGWLVLVIIGGVYTIGDLSFFNISKFTGAIALIGVGVYLILKPHRTHPIWGDCRKRHANFEEVFEERK